MMKRALALLLCVAVTSACGTILHPERKGQVDGRIDAGVAVLDGLGLLFFIIPGVIAFAVDFTDGAIYLPKGHVRFDPKKARPADLEALITRRTGVAFRFDDPDVIVSAKPG
jgi:hypothetical protein